MLNSASFWVRITKQILPISTIPTEVRQVRRLKLFSNQSEKVRSFVGHRGVNQHNSCLKTCPVRTLPKFRNREMTELKTK